MTALFERVTAFGTDIVGLERFLRLLQCLCMILTSYAVLPHLDVPLRELTSSLNLTRRTVRLFWWMGSFRGGERPWLDLVGDTMLGMFGAMESATLLDLVGVQGVRLFGYEEARRMDGQAQGLWLGGLVCAVLGDGMRLFSGEGGTKTKEVEGKTERMGGKGKMEEKKRKVCRRALVGKMVAEMLDMVIPAWGMGLVRVEDGVVAVAMLGSTLLTGWAVWERCGRHV